MVGLLLLEEAGVIVTGKLTLVEEDLCGRTAR